MLIKLGLILGLCATVLLCGGHWMALQGVAWTAMLIDYSKESGSITQGIGKTFSGKAPCGVCLKIQSGHQKESRIPAVLGQGKMRDYYLPWGALPLPSPAWMDVRYSSLVERGWPQWTGAPPGPVPRSV